MLLIHEFLIERVYCISHKEHWKALTNWNIAEMYLHTHTHTRSLSLFSHLYFHFYLDAKNSGRDYDVLCFDPNTVENYSKSVWIISHVICTNTVFQLMFNECVECACAYVFVCVQTSV